MLRQIINNREHFKINICLIFNADLKKFIPTRLGFYMNKQLRFIVFLLLVFFLQIRNSYSQAVFASEEELKQQAAKLFEEDEFEEAYPLYSQLVSLYPKDPNHNYHLGVCMLYASDDKEKPIPFLEFAAKSPEVEKEVIFYLAKAYHLNYRFDDAIGKYNAYKKVASSSKAEKLLVDRQIEMCKNGKKLLRNLTDLIVIDKKEISKADFYRAYDISDIGGKLLAKPDEEAFKTSLDKKKKEKSIIYLSTNNNQVYFSSFGDDIEHGKDIYVIRKLPNGEWSKAQTLGYPVNTEYDEDFPFLHPNGKVLYFCSKGHNSMGGYDIFKTTLNEETNTWNKPVNIDFPINTPDDDILYVTNTDEKEAFFASARSSKTGKIAVFHINVERRPIEVAVIKGFVMKNRDNQALDVKITVKDLGDNTILGIYNAKETGGYLINLPNGGKFMYTVEAAGFNTQSEVVVLPTQYEFKPLKQEISYELGTDKLIVKNLFDEPVDDQSYMLALNFIKEKSKMEINANETGNNASIAKTENNAADNKTEEQNTAIDSGNKTDNSSKNTATAAKLSNNDIIKIANDDAKEAEKEAKDLQEQADIALNFANSKNELAQNKSKEATQLMSDANNMTDNVKKQTAIEEANQARTEADELNEETVAAFNIAKKLALKAAAKNEEAELSVQYAKDLEAAVKSKNPEEALVKLLEQEKKLEALSEKNGVAEPDNIFTGLKMDEETKKRELDKALKTNEDIRQEIADNETLIASLKTDADKTKKEDVKNGILDQIEGLKADNEQSKKDLELNEQKIAKIQKEYNGIKNEIALVSTVVDKAKTETNENAAASVATIDKVKLEQQVNELKNTIESDSYVSVSRPADNSNTSVKFETNPEKSNTGLAVNNSENKTTENNVSDNGNKTDNSTADNIAANTSKKDKNAPNSEKSNETAVNNNVSENNYAAVKERLSEQLNAANDISNELERENKKAELYKIWEASINEELIQKRENLKEEKDKSKKKELSNYIAALEKDMAEKMDAEKATLATLDKLKQQSIVSNSASNVTDNDSSATNAAENPVTSDAAQPVSIGAVNDLYSGRLADAEKITAPAEREQAKADVLNSWAKEVKVLVDKQKDDFVKTDDPEMKALLAKKISDAEEVIRQKQALADESTNKAKTLASQSLAVSNTENPSSSNATSTEEKKSGTGNETQTDIAKTDVNKDKNGLNSESDNKSAGNTAENTISNNKDVSNPAEKTGTATTEVKTIEDLNNAIALADKNPDELKKETIKKEALTSYISNANIELEEKQTLLKTEKNKSRKKELTGEIAGKEAEIKNKQDLLNTVEAKLNVLEEQLSSTLSDNKKSFTETSSDNAIYSNSAAIETSKNASIAYKESENLLMQANDLKEEASEKPDGPEKDAMYLKASELVKSSESKKLIAEQLSSDANRSEFNSGKNKLDQYAAVSANNPSDEIAMAEMLKDESLVYFEKANKSRTLADNLSSGYDKATALEDALNNEKTALQKQKKAEELYKKNNQGLVVNNTGITSSENNIALNTANSENQSLNSGDENKTISDNSVALNPKTTENISDSATKTIPEIKQNESLSGNQNGNVQVEKSNTNETSKDESASLAVNENADKTETINSDSNKNPDNITASDTINKSVSETEIAKNTSEAFDETKDIAVNNINENSTSANGTAKDENPSNSTSVNETATAKTTGEKVVKLKTALDVSEKFEIQPQPVYSASKPIPVNEKLPEGLIYKVQIGAFRNSISPDVFAGMTPLTAETTPQGLTRYTAGIFTKFSTADKVKEEIRDLGYKDAFVVIFLNGRRISIAEAAKLTGDNSILAAGSTASSSSKNTDNSVPAVNENQPVNQVKNSGSQNGVTPGDFAKTQDIVNVQGLFYTVQVGVYSNPVSSAKLHNIQPLYAETTPNGYLRYNTGLYNNISRAIEARKVVYEAGVKDAFVTAYYQGRRISLSEAQNMEAQGSGAFSTAGNVNQLPDISSDTQSSVPVIESLPVKNTEPENKSTPLEEKNETSVSTILEKTISENKQETETGVVFKVQIGAFKEEVPLEIANQFIQLAGKGIKNYKDDNGLTVYTLGSFKTYEDASKLKAEITLIVKDAFVVAYNNGKKVSIDEAKALENK